MRAGAVVDIEAADRAIRLAVEAAERMAGVRIGEVIVSVAGGRPRCEVYSGETRVMTADVGPADMQRAISSALQKLDGGGRAVLHATPVQYHIDDAHGVKQPLGMFGQTLSVDVNAVMVEPGAIRNLGLAIGRCHLDIANYVIAPYAGARAVLVDDEMALGVTYVEMGARPPASPPFAKAGSSSPMSYLSAASISPTTSPAGSRPALPMPSASRRFTARHCPRPTTTGSMWSCRFSASWAWTRCTACRVRC